MIIDKPSGKVRGVEVKNSTGNLFLDCDVINTFLQWRFKPNTEQFITIVVAFGPENDVASYPVGPPAYPGRRLPATFTEPITPAKLNQWFPIY
ncbi:MAG: hypothetical protein ABI925_12445 [Verrucomicrobiota bacterium]